MTGWVAASPPFKTFRTQLLELGDLAIQAEIADTEAQRRQGLMHRTELPRDGGMLFVYPEPTLICMWMKNTLIPLDVAFFDRTGALLNVESMEPQTLNPHCSEGDAAFALEMNQGWFKSQKPGSFSRLNISKIQAGTSAGGQH